MGDQAKPILPADVEAFVATIERYVDNGDGGADEKDTREMIAIIRAQGAKILYVSELYATKCVELHRSAQSVIGFAARLAELSAHYQKLREHRSDSTWCEKHLHELATKHGADFCSAQVVPCAKCLMAERDALRDRLAKLEKAARSHLDTIFGLRFTPSEFNERAQASADELARAITGDSNGTTETK